jgi:hypothetical protein
MATYIHVTLLRQMRQFALWLYELGWNTIFEVLWRYQFRIESIAMLRLFDWKIIAHVSKGRSASIFRTKKSEKMSVTVCHSLGCRISRYMMLTFASVDSTVWYIVSDSV